MLADEVATGFEGSTFKLSIAEYGKVALTVIGGMPGNDIGVVIDKTGGAVNAVLPTKD